MDHVTNLKEKEEEEEEGEEEAWECRTMASDSEDGI